MIEKVRIRSEEMPVSLTMVERKRVKKVKLTIKPITTPNGLLFPLSIPPDSTIGSTGKMHGDNIVTNPAMKANATRIIILNYY